MILAVAAARVAAHILIGGDFLDRSSGRKIRRHLVGCEQDFAARAAGNDFRIPHGHSALRLHRGVQLQIQTAGRQSVRILLHANRPKEPQ